MGTVRPVGAKVALFVPRRLYGVCTDAPLSRVSQSEGEYMYKSCSTMVDLRCSKHHVSALRVEQASRSNNLKASSAASARGGFKSVGSVGTT